VTGPGSSSSRTKSGADMPRGINPGRRLLASECQVRASRGQ
jgi:hypothetical protein